MSLLHEIMMIRLTLPVVLNIKGIADIGNLYCISNSEKDFFSFVSASVFLSSVCV
jgi:hypothetical protein